MAGAERRWEDLNKDVLVTILGKLWVEDLVSGIPFVCASWNDASKDPCCWRKLDFRDWDSISRRIGGRRQPEVDFRDLLRFAVNWGDASLEAVWFPCFAGEADVLYVAERCPGLRYFSLKNEEDIQIDKFCKAIGKLEFLRGMAVDKSVICEDVLQQIGRSCLDFSELKVFSNDIDEDIAKVICRCLPHLKKLELSFCRMSRQVLLFFLDELKDLEYLDVSGNEVQGITSTVLEKASRLKVFHWDFDSGELDYCFECGQVIIFQKLCACMLD